MNTTKPRKRRTPKERLAALDLTLAKLARIEDCPNKSNIATIRRTIRRSATMHPDEVLRSEALAVEQIIKLTRLTIRYGRLREGRRISIIPFFEGCFLVRDKKAQQEQAKGKVGR